MEDTAFKQLSQRERELFELLQAKPRSALLMARLSDVFMQQSVLASQRSGIKAASTQSSTVSTVSSCCCPLRMEALKWAKQSVEQAPNRPFGYISLSAAAPSLSERMNSLDHAIEIIERQQQENYIDTISKSNVKIKNSTSTTHIPVAVLFARRLIEPRHEEIQLNSNGSSLGRGDARHPSRRGLSPFEAQIYARLQLAMDDEWKTIHLPSTTSSQTPTDSFVNCLGRYEYRLGTFFRKMEPRTTHRFNSQRHFERAAKELVSVDPSLAREARFWLATLGDERSVSHVSRCPPEYIIGLYSTFAKRFDTCLLQGLQYQTPAKLRFLVDQIALVVRPRNSTFSSSSSPTFRRALDLGCGTGLSGTAFSDCVHHMTGVDLSPEMLQLAQERGCYHELVQADLVAFVKQQRDAFHTAVMSNPRNFEMKYDLIVAADVLVYLGDLGETFTGIGHLLSENGIFAGSSEFLEGDRSSASVNYVLQDCGRFAHSQTYLEKLIVQTGLKLEQMEISTIRKNNGRDVKGVLFCVSKRC